MIKIENDVLYIDDLYMGVIDQIENQTYLWVDKSDYYISSKELRQIADKLDELNGERDET